MLKEKMKCWPAATLTRRGKDGLFASFGTGWCFNPVPKALPLSATGQRYQLLLQSVLMRSISTGCNSSWYLWPRPLAHFLVVTSHWNFPVCQEIFWWYHKGSQRNSNFLVGFLVIEISLCVRKFFGGTTKAHREILISLLVS
jgi:hypothetical protein